MPIRLLELFGGIGACSAAFDRLGIPYTIADYVEIDKYAVKSYNAIHNTNFEPQDISKWDKNIEVDVIMHGSPCQDFSIAGFNKGGDKDSGTRSSLMYETIRIVEKLRPKYVIWENVKNLLGKQHRHNFDNYIQIMKDLGYDSYYKVLNAKDYGIPQNRERVFTISIRGGGFFQFPDGIELDKRLKDLLEPEVNPKYYISEQRYNNLINIPDNKHKPNILEEDGEAKTLTSVYYKRGNFSQYVKVKTISKRGFDKAFPGDPVSVAYPNSTTRRGSVQNGVANTVTRHASFEQTAVMEDLRLRVLTPLECWRLMGFTDEYYNREAAVNSETQLYKQAGNSIVVNVLEAILKSLLTGTENKQITLFDLLGG